MPKSDNVSMEVERTFGQVARPAAQGNETVKTPVMSFSQDNIYLGLKIVTPFDEKTGAYKEPAPRITASFNGTFVNYPVDGKFWKAFAEFAAKMADALEGVKVTQSTVYDDVDTAKQLMAQFRNKSPE